MWKSQPEVKRLFLIYILFKIYINNCESVVCKNQVLFAVFLLSRRIISMSYLVYLLFENIYLLVEKILLWNVLIVGLMSKYDVILYNLSQQKVCTFFQFLIDILNCVGNSFSKKYFSFPSLLYISMKINGPKQI